MKSSKILAVVAMASLFAASSFAADEEIVAKYGAITIKKVKNSAGVEMTVADIDDDSKETPVITENIEVDSVFFNRKFKKGAFSTLMLPIEADVSAFSLTGLQVFRFIEVTKDCKENGCKFRVNCRTVSAGTYEANTPYVVLSEQKDNAQISYHADNAHKIVLNTTTHDKVYSYVVKENVDQPYKFSFTGTYESIEFKNPKGIYGFAGTNADGKKVGDFVHVACKDGKCASIRPFRAYLKVTLASLNKSASDDDVEMPETIEVYLVDDNKGTTYIGQLNTSTGEIVKEDNRWFDMKGRVLDHKPTAKGTYYNNKKKVIIK